jgi:hypothetical protein
MGVRGRHAEVVRRWDSPRLDILAGWSGLLGAGLQDVQVRILVSFAGGHGHWLPTVPLARALGDQGHDVRYACQDAMVSNVIAAGWRAYPDGAATMLGPDERLPLVAPDREANERAIARGIDRNVGERARLLIEVCGRWRPELILRDEVGLRRRAGRRCARRASRRGRRPGGRRTVAHGTDPRTACPHPD